MKDMAEAGHYVATCYTAEDAIQVLTEYCSLPKATELKLSPIAEPVKLMPYQKMKEANNSIWKEEQSHNLNGGSYGIQKHGRS